MKSHVQLALIMSLPLALALPALAKNARSSPGDDICDLRPNLCAETASPKKMKKKKAKMMAGRRPSSSTFRPQTERRGLERPRANVTFESYLLSNANHPALARRPASMTINQKAFVQPPPRSTITGSTLDQPQSLAAPAGNTSQSNAPTANFGHGVGDAQPSPNGINPGDAPSYAPANDGSSGSPLH